MEAKLAGEEVPVRPRKRQHAFAKAMKNWELYLLLLPTLIYFIVFQYGPMYGLQIAFKDFSAIKGIMDSPWVGFKHFVRFFESYSFEMILWNTLKISLYELAVFPIPIIMALLINQLVNTKFKKLVQTITYAPHFISVVVIIGMLQLFLSPRNGLVNHLLQALGMESVYFLGEPGWFTSIFVFSGLWQNAGWGTIIYLAALTSISPDLHEAAVVDGASKLKRILYIDIPGIMPTIIILLILNVGSFLTVGFQKIYLMQNPLNIEAAEVIQTYVYKSGLVGAQFSYSAAIGLFNNVANFILLVTMNKIAKKAGQSSLW
ncbi:sugar ABC transporter permease [Paenibacillus sp. F411]|uniref:ABC transporter permease n=1 Tax=Paenibacillus sp. F411 TaxID=2820239 RepID=UPI001AAE91D7|nr:ABC transporter permease subunit [Paenibacillus sp. F411]MBO2944373.1 sugar ABC transporter permease [Paenibacillus sp. F411]